ncbi:MAG TPA: cation:proton antiporter [Oscillatoriales bacterium UBA8482]|nr:MAG: cation:proton antiporter [Oscillatoriales cyanobacterium CG2_30_40_61]HBW58610.1 cation:proton antiporter [Oscillatoriales bacterium UBA8482]
MIAYLNLSLRLVIWFLLTANFSLTNIMIGVGIAFLLPGLKKKPTVLTDWFGIFYEILIAIPRAYAEALEMIFRPHNYEEITREEVKPRRTPGLIFLDIFVITFTPKTIVFKYHEDGWYGVHWLRRRRPR